MRQTSRLGAELPRRATPPRVEMGRVLTGYARAAIVTAGLAAALAVTSCSDGADAEPTPTSAGSSSSTSSSASSSSTASSSSSTSSSTATVNVPAAARAHTEAGAKAFAAYYVQAVSRSGFTADSTELRAITRPSCKGCAVFVELADELKADGQHVDRKSIVLRDQMVRPNSTRDRVIVDCLIEDLPSKIVDSKGKTVSNEPGEKLTLRNTLVWEAGRWVVSESLMVQS
jgi:hypothetical protein